MNDDCQCLLCKPVAGKRAHPIYGYDLDRVKTVHCAVCGEIIGDEPYVEVLGLARFGSMNLSHAKCETQKDARARVRMEKNWHSRTSHDRNGTMGTKKKAKAEPVETPAADQPALAVGMIWTDPRDGQKYNVVEATDEVPCKGCHYFVNELDCPESDSEGTTVCESAVGDPVKFVKIGAPKTDQVLEAMKARPEIVGGKAKKAKPEKKAPCQLVDGYGKCMRNGGKHYGTKCPGDCRQKETEGQQGPLNSGLTTCQRDIPSALLVGASWNARGEISDESVADLVASIRAMGLLQRVIVRADEPDSAGERYVILAGHRRAKACVLAGFDPVPCDVVECDDKQARMITAVENLHRSDLTAMQEAEVVEGLLAVGLTAEEVADQTGRNLRWVYRRASIRTLADVWRNAAHAYGLCAAFLEEVSRLPVNTQESLHGKLLNRWNGREALQHGGDVEVIKSVASDLTMLLATAPWSKKHPEWCENCERCSNANANLFDETEIGAGAMCLDEPCWEQRKTALVEEQRVELARKHGEVRTASDEDYRYGKFREAKGRKDKDHSVPVLITDGDNAGKTVWVAGAADKAAAKDRGDTVPGSKQPSLAEKRMAWVIRKVRDMIADSRKEGSLDNPFLRFNGYAVLQTIGVTGTEHSNSWHKPEDWGELENKTEVELHEFLWGRVAPVLIARMNYPTITDCGDYYKEAVAQAAWLFGMAKDDLDAEAAEAIKDKSKKGEKI